MDSHIDEFFLGIIYEFPYMGFYHGDIWQANQECSHCPSLDHLRCTFCCSSLLEGDNFPTWGALEKKVEIEIPSILWGFMM